MRRLTAIIAYVLVGVLLCLNIYQYHRGKTAPLPFGVYTDTLTVYDTIPVIKPVPKDSVVVRYVVQKLPVSVPKSQESVSEPPDSVLEMPESVPDSSEVVVPISSKVYETEDYRAVVSGFRPSLDTLLLFRPTQIVRFREKPKRWGIGIQVGYGVTVGNTPQLAPYIGVGVSYNFLNF
mgnify:CR=1 FL=1